jgi:hypothetical protein
MKLAAIIFLALAVAAHAQTPSPTEIALPDADFVRTLRTAEQLEAKGEIGSSLAWYLKAQKIYPASEFAQQGIDRLVKKVLPDH